MSNKNNIVPRLTKAEILAFLAETLETDIHPFLSLGFVKEFSETRHYPDQNGDPLRVTVVFLVEKIKPDEYLLAQQKTEVH